MASTNKTANYELSQFIGTDKPAWLADYNSDMEKIDIAIKNTSDATATAQTTAETAQSSADSAGQTASTALNTAQSASSTATTAQTTAETASNNASTAITTANEAKTTADGLATAVQTAQTTANTANGKADTNATNITTLNSNVATLASQFNLNTTVTKNVSEFLPNTAFNVLRGSLNFSQNTDGTIFKVYGQFAYQATGGVDQTVNMSEIPHAQDQTTYYGIDTGFVLNSLPENAYIINCAGSGTAKTSGTGFVSLYGFDLAVGTNGHIYLFPDTSSTHTNWALDEMSVVFNPCTYFNKNLGDEISPLPNPE